MGQLLASASARQMSSARLVTPVKKVSLVSLLTTPLAVKIVAATQLEHLMRLSRVTHKQDSVCARGTSMG